MLRILRTSSPTLGQASRVCLRSQSTLGKSTKNGPSALEHPAKYLVGLQNKDAGERLSKEEADKEAKAWIDALKQLRSEFTNDGEQVYQPGKALAPSGTSEIDIFQQAIDAQTGNKFQPTEAQKEEFAVVKGTEIPQKFDDTMQYLTNLIMSDGKKARAEKTMAQALYLVHLKSRKDPVSLLKKILEDMAPLVKLKRYTDGGARAELVPVPLTEKQRIRQAWVWILEAANKRPSKDFSVRLAGEILSAASGKSPGFEKRNQQHKLAIVNRSFIKLLTKKR